MNHPFLEEGGVSRECEEGGKHANSKSPLHSLGDLANNGPETGKDAADVLGNSSAKANARCWATSSPAEEKKITHSRKAQWVERSDPARRNRRLAVRG